MSKLSQRALHARDRKRDIGAEILQGIRDIKAGKGKVISVSDVAQVRASTGLSQQKFADLLGVSVRTYQEWEQGRREPKGAARSLLTIAKRRPDVLKEVFAE